MTGSGGGRRTRARWIAVIVVLLAWVAAFTGMAVAGADAQLCNPASVDANQMCHFDASGPFSDISMVFPANYPDEQTIIGYLTKTSDDFANARGPLSALKSPTALKATGTRYSSGTQATGTQSVVTEVYQNLGAAHPLVWYKSFNYNLANQQPITFDALFQPGSQPLQAILPIVQKTLADRYRAPVSIPPATGLEPANYQSFAITNDAIVFFFDQNALQPAMEATQVSVSRSAIASMISPDIA
ncbi:esterase [Mycobacterium sp. 94-17]|uniref:esterase n=1 Tax=Mycobacterium sp. 94-17 TaxID=2986147 RepID=UPI002D1F5029|nr:esterase [Mycobacterium sp. 94-17]MEB4209308.1 RsiV family protein [Mycobacterium sp. 94-17]